MEIRQEKNTTTTNNMKHGNGVVRNGKRRPGVTGWMLANELGVSPMTVCLVLGDKPGPSDETRKRVLDLAKKLRYTPNAAGRMMRDPGLRVSGLVAVIVSPVNDHRLQSVVRAIQDGQRFALVYETTEVSAGLDNLRRYQPDLVVNLLSDKVLPETRKLLACQVYEGGTRKGGGTLGSELDKILASLPVLNAPLALLEK